jgi:hypothetical protein
MRAAKAKVAALHPKEKDVEVEAKAKALEPTLAKDEDGTQTQRRLQPPSPSQPFAPSTRKVRPPRDLPHLTKANAATVASTATKLGIVANASMRNPRNLNVRQTTV